LKKSIYIRDIFILITLLLALSGASCFNTGKEPAPGGSLRFEQNFIGPFDTVTTLLAYCEDEASFRQLEDLVSEDLDHYHTLFDFYNNYAGVNNIKTINDEAGKTEVDADQVIIDFLEQCKWAADITDGRVNVAFGSVLSIWHRQRTEGLENPSEAKLPKRAELEQANLHTNIEKLQIDREAGTVYLQDPHMSLDVGSGAKGFACELITEHAIAAGFDSFVLSLGGNVRCVGVKADSGEKWNIGIKNPDVEAENKVLDVLSVSDMAIVTSGIYERYYTVGEIRYHHIIHPNTLMPSEFFDSVTLIAPDARVADALTTALLNMPLEEGQELVAELEDCEALWIKDGRRYKTAGYDTLLAAD
jgi:thiamine biosynthesis lipoprotein